MSKKKKVGRPRIGQPISVTLTDEQKAWVDAQIPPGGARTEVIRDLVEQAIADDRRPRKRAG